MRVSITERLADDLLQIRRIKICLRYSNRLRHKSSPGIDVSAAAAAAASTGGVQLQSRHSCLSLIKATPTTEKDGSNMSLSDGWVPGWDCF